MAFTGNYTADSFKFQLLTLTHNFNFGGDTFKLALYDNSVSFTNTTTIYSSDGEVLAGGDYLAGGVILTPIIGSMPLVAYATFDSVTINNVVFPYAYGGLIYNASKSNAAVVILDFGGARYPAANGQFRVTLPIATPTESLIRIS